MEVARFRANALNVGTWNSLTNAFWLKDDDLPTRSGVWVDFDRK